jgi:hypothetical protein
VVLSFLDFAETLSVQVDRHHYTESMNYKGRTFTTKELNWDQYESPRYEDWNQHDEKTSGWSSRRLLYASPKHLSWVVSRLRSIKGFFCVGGKWPLRLNVLTAISIRGLVNVFKLIIEDDFFSSLTLAVRTSSVSSMFDAAVQRGSYDLIEFILTDVVKTYPSIRPSGTFLTI